MLSFCCCEVVVVILQAHNLLWKSYLFDVLHSIYKLCPIGAQIRGEMAPKPNLNQT